jgi:hypothetical protein
MKRDVILVELALRYDSYAIEQGRATLLASRASTCPSKNCFYDILLMFYVLLWLI